MCLGSRFTMWQILAISLGHRPVGHSSPMRPVFVTQWCWASLELTLMMYWEMQSKLMTPTWGSVVAHHEWQHQLLSLCLFIWGSFGLLLYLPFPSLPPPLSWSLFLSKSLPSPFQSLFSCYLWSNFPWLHNSQVRTASCAESLTFWKEMDWLAQLRSIQSPLAILQE